MKRFAILFAALGLLSLTSCSNLTQQEQQALSDGAIGAAGGAVLGAVVGGSPAIGAAVGGAVGTATGALWDDIQMKINNEYAAGRLRQA